nr:hypothetical protein HK105_006947 [Polyrhizophydium stewartii]
MVPAAHTWHLGVPPVRLPAAARREYRPARTGPRRRPSTSAEHPAEHHPAESTALGPVKVDPALAAHNTVPLQPSGVPIQPLPDLVGIPVHVAEPRPDAVLGHDSAGPHGVLAHPALVITRQLEMMNVLIGYEQANKYAIKDPAGNDVGFIAEEETSISGTVLRQLMRTRRAFKAVVLDRNGAVVLKIDRPVKWLLNSTITIRDGDDNIIGEAKQVWHLWRRKYDLFLGKRQFAIIDGGFWAWDFELRDESDGLLGSVNRNFVGFAREIFTDTGQYAVHMDSTPNLARPLSLDERAVMLATAISIDIDYFSRHSSSGGGIMPLPFFGMGGHGGSDVPATVPGGDVAPIPSGGGGGGMMPPVFIPGVGVGGGAGSSPAPPVPPSGAPPADAAPGGTDAVPNQWGETPFLTDEQAGISSGDSGLSLNDVWKWLSDD